MKEDVDEGGMSEEPAQNVERFNKSPAVGMPLGWGNINFG